MMNLETIRARCAQFLDEALDRGDEARAEQLLELRDRLAEKDCLSNRKMVHNRSAIVNGLQFSFQEVREFKEYLENCTKVRGLLYVVGADGVERSVEAILDPQNESYIRFLPGPICKQRYIWEDYYETYSLIDGRWVYDGSLERMFTDTGYEYEYLRYKVLSEL